MVLASLYVTCAGLLHSRVLPVIGRRLLWFAANYCTHGKYYLKDTIDIAFKLALQAIADVLRDEGLLYAEKLQEAGVSVQQCMTPTSHLGATVMYTEERQTCLEYLRQALAP